MTEIRLGAEVMVGDHAMIVTSFYCTVGGAVVLVLTPIPEGDDIMGLGRTFEAVDPIECLRSLFQNDTQE